MELRHLGAMAIMFLIAGIVISIGTVILHEMRVQRCEDIGGTYVANTVFDNSTPQTLRSGCCTSFYNTSYCDAYSTTSSYNITDSGIEGTTTLADWLPLIALVVAASIVIGVIVGYMGRQ